MSGLLEDHLHDWLVSFHDHITKSWVLVTPITLQHIYLTALRDYA
jgi:hypothetical protein